MMMMLKAVVEDTRTVREEQKRTSEEIQGMRKEINEIAQNQEQYKEETRQLKESNEKLVRELDGLKTEIIERE